MKKYIVNYDGFINKPSKKTDQKLARKKAEGESYWRARSREYDWGYNRDGMSFGRCDSQGF